MKTQLNTDKFDLVPNRDLPSIPRLNTTRSEGMDAGVYAHIYLDLFVDGKPTNEWYVTEVDETGDTAYGYVISNGEHLGFREFDLAQLKSFVETYKETRLRNHRFVREVDVFSLGDVKDHVAVPCIN